MLNILKSFILGCMHACMCMCAYIFVCGVVWMCADTQKLGKGVGSWEPNSGVIRGALITEPSPKLQLPT